MIVFVLGAGVVTVFVKSDTTTSPTASGPAPTASVAVTVQPSTTVSPTQPLAAHKNAEKKIADDVMPVPHLPASGVADHPFGFLLVALGGLIAFWVRRAARA